MILCLPSVIFCHEIHALSMSMRLPVFAKATVNIKPRMSAADTGFRDASVSFRRDVVRRDPTGAGG